jgi:hypothetical protein
MALKIDSSLLSHGLLQRKMLEEKVLSLKFIE